MTADSLIQTASIASEATVASVNPAGIISVTMRHLRFQPIYQTRVWGGRQLETLLNRKLPDGQPYGESWELCDRPEAQSIVAEGPLAGRTLSDLWTKHRKDTFGSRHLANPSKHFPILLKILDCSDVLSLQVHPPAAMAPSLGGEPKTEMWFVVHADKEALIYAGLRRGATHTKFEAALRDGTVAELVHRITPHQGEFMFVESGRIHALGAGLLVYEIQQNSDTTYRVFDWNRAGLDGKQRALHVAESLACINFEDFEPTMKSPSADGRMVSCPYFTTTHHKLIHGKSIELQTPDDDFVCLAIVRGCGVLAKEELHAGDFLILPAGRMTRTLTAFENGMEWLEVRLPCMT